MNLKEPEEKSMSRKRLQDNKTTDDKTVTIESVDQLQTMVDAPVYCTFSLDGTTVRVPCKRVSQDLDEEVRRIRREAQPPFLKERGTSGDYDYTNAAYLAKRDRNEKVARAVLVYSGCPAIAAKKPGLRNAEEIYQFVKGVWTENILELIALTIQAGGMELVDRANFTSTSASES
jgi:hypothetical protein